MENEGFHNETKLPEPIQLRVAQIEQLYSQAPSAIYSALLATGMLTAVLWENAPRPYLITWAVSVTILYLARHLLVIGFRRRAPKGEAALVWGKWFSIGSALAGAMWGLAAIVFFPSESVLYQAVLVILTGGLASGTIIVYSSYVWAYLPIIFLGGLPVIAMFFYQGTHVHRLIGSILFIYMGVITLIARRMHTTITAYLKLRFEKEEIIQALEAQKVRDDQLNQNLENEIAQRIRIESELREARDNLEARVDERTLELRGANEELRKQIGERERIEEELRQSEEKYRKLVDYASEGIFVAQDGKLKFVNPRCTELSGYSEVELLERDVSSLLYLDDRQHIMQHHIRRMKGDQTPFRGRLRIIDIEGNLKWTELNTVAIKWEGRPAALGLITDIEDRKRAEDLEIQNVRYRAVADLANGVAHNFNNLLQVAVGHVEIALFDLKEASYNEVNKSLLQILEACRLGARTVKRLQSFAGIGQTNDLSEQTSYDLTEIVQQAIDITKPFWEGIPQKEGVEVTVQSHFVPGCMVIGDRVRLFEVIVNLLKNASEAVTAAGGGDITISTFIENNNVVARIQDTGIGINEENRKRLFNPFYTTKVEAGSGLGLAVSERTVNELGGRIFVSSIQGSGTTFNVVLPLAAQSVLHTTSTVEAITATPLTVLLVDDQQSTLKVLEGLLSSNEHKIVSATSGKKAIELFEDSHFDIVICDLGMPDVNGWDVGKAIVDICRKREVPKTPFILLTGWSGQDAEKEKINESGVDHIIDKPVEINALIRTMETLVRGLNSENP
jgi:two-component system cell cycle sensor histidine kinase/response regulator CckA